MLSDIHTGPIDHTVRVLSSFRNHKMFRLRDFVSSTSWSRDKRRPPRGENGVLSTDSSPRIETVVIFFRHKSVTPTSLSRRKVPKNVGATGFEPATSWSQKVLTLPNTANMGHFAQILVHQVHRITQSNYSLVTVALVWHPHNHKRQSVRHKEHERVRCVLHELR
jgi:hypothetical protein